MARCKVVRLWVPVPGFPGYEVSRTADSCGAEFRSVPRVVVVRMAAYPGVFKDDQPRVVERIIQGKPVPIRHKRTPVVCLSRDGTPHWVRVADILAAVFPGDPILAGD